MSTAPLPPLRDLDIRLLRIYKAVVECQGFAAAEETLGIGRSTISKHVGDLESRLGIRLCDRGRSGFNTTPHGQIVYQSILELLDSLENFRWKIASAKSRLVGSVSLWIMDSTLLELGNPIGKALHLFHARPGQVALAINAAAPNLVEDAVATRRANVGVTIARTGISGLKYQPVGNESVSLYCATTHPLVSSRPVSSITDADIRDCQFVTRGYLRNIDIPRGVTASNATATAHHVDATVQFILTGRYIGALPDHIANPWVRSKMLAKLPFPELSSTSSINVVSRANTSRNPIVSALIDDIAEAYKSAAIRSTGTR